MGRANLEAMLEITNMETALAWHLQSNLYPAVPSTMLVPAKRAIDFVRDGKPDHPVALALPNGNFARLYHGSTAYTAPPARLLVQMLRLEAFITPAEEV